MAGEAKRRKSKTERLLEQHPVCCFCGGNTPASTTDHVPNRACFKGKAFPEGFEFPACDQCQRSTRAHEQFFAFMCHLSDRNPNNDDRDQSRKLISGIRNNYPHLFPRVASANEKRRGLRWLGQGLPTGKPLSEVPMISFPPDITPIINKAAAKIGLAIYYRHVRRPAPPSHALTAFWTQASNRNQMANFNEVAKDLRFHEKGWRANLDFGDRFAYRWNVSENGSSDPEAFMMMAQFGQGIVICVLIADGNQLPNTDDEGEWVSVERLWAND